MRESRDATDPGALERLARGVIRFRWVVLAVWLVVFVASMAAASGLPDLFKSRAALPGTDSQRVDDVLEKHFGQKSIGAFTLVARDEDRPASALVPGLTRSARAAAGALPTGKVASVQAVSDHVASAEIVSNLDPLDAQDHVAAMRRAAGALPGAETWLTGGPAIQEDLQPKYEQDLKVGELYIALPIALAVLVFVFGTAAFLIPFLFAFAAIPATLAVVWVFAHFMDMEQTVQNLVTLIGLGIAIDYSLLMVTRYREELHRAGGDREQAVAQTVRTAGHAVLFSGTAVAIGLALLTLVPVPGIRGYGVAGLVIPLVSVVCALTLLPVVLYWAERPLDRVRLVPKRVLQRRQSIDDSTSLWMRHAHRIMRRPVPYFVTALGLLLAFAAPVLALELGPGTNEQLPSDVRSVQGLRVLQSAVGDGALTPTEIVIDTGRARGFDRPEQQAAEEALFEGLGKDPEVVAISDFNDGPQHEDPTGRYVHIQATGAHDAGLPASEQLVHRIRDRIVPAAGFPPGTGVFVGGSAAFGVDFVDKTYDAFPFLVAGVMLFTYVLLLRAFRSLLLPLKAIVLNVLSISAAFGLLVAFFKWGWGEPFGLLPYDQVTAWVPVFLFAMLFGLSMDYEVFLVTRMREEWDARQDNAEAVAVGLARTGRLVTAAGFIMFAAFMGFVAGSFVDLQQFGFGLAVAILIDVTIVRALLLPSAMRLFGRWNWWLPERVARIARVEPSPLAPAGAPAPVVAVRPGEVDMTLRAGAPTPDGSPAASAGRRPDPPAP